MSPYIVDLLRRESVPTLANIPTFSAPAIADATCTLGTLCHSRKYMCTLHAVYRGYQAYQKRFSVRDVKIDITYIPTSRSATILVFNALSCL